MPAKWQQWMPFNIDAFKSSPAVRAMHPAARSGYLYLLSFAWQTEDCTLPADQLELAEISEIGDDLWHQHGNRIMRKFELLENGRYRNATLFEEWEKARRIFAKNHASPEEVSRKRSEAGQKGNKVRWKDRKPSQKDGNCDESTSQTDRKTSHTYTGTETKDIPPNARATPPEDPPPVSPAFVETARQVGEALREMAEPARDYFEGRELQVANDLLRENQIPVTHALTVLAGQALVFECDRLGSPEFAIESMRSAIREAKARGDTINRFWFEDQEYDESKRKARSENSGENKPSPTRQRVERNLGALAKTLERRGIRGVDLPGRTDGPALPEPRPGGFSGGVRDGLRATGVEAFAGGCEGSSGGAPHSPRAEVLPPAG